MVPILEIPGESDNVGDFGKFGRLYSQRSDPDPASCPVDRGELIDGHQEHDRHGIQPVSMAADHLIGRHSDRDHCQRGEGDPNQLAGKEPSAGFSHRVAGRDARQPDRQQQGGRHDHGPGQVRNTTTGMHRCTRPWRKRSMRDDYTGSTPSAPTPISGRVSRCSRPTRGQGEARWLAVADSGPRTRPGSQAGAWERGGAWRHERLNAEPPPPYLCNR